MTYMGKIGLLPRAPLRLLFQIRVAASVYDVRDGGAKATPNAFQRQLTALILDGVMQQCGDCLIFGSAKLENEPGHR